MLQRTPCTPTLPFCRRCRRFELFVGTVACAKVSRVGNKGRGDAAFTLCIVWVWGVRRERRDRERWLRRPGRGLRRRGTGRDAHTVTKGVWCVFAVSKFQQSNLQTDSPTRNSVISISPTITRFYLRLVYASLAARPPTSHPRFRRSLRSLRCQERPSAALAFEALVLRRCRLPGSAICAAAQYASCAAHTPMCPNVLRWTSGMRAVCSFRWLPSQLLNSLNVGPTACVKKTLRDSLGRGCRLAADDGDCPVEALTAHHLCSPAAVRVLRIPTVRSGSLSDEIRW